MNQDDRDENILTHLSLCSGIGGLDLAAEWAGFKTIGQCEIDEYASRVLAKNFQGVFNYGDIRTITNDSLASRGIFPGATTILSAGFPCQPYSLAGKGLGDSDSRDLWAEVNRCIGIIKPKWFVGENTPGLFSRANQRYFARVVNDLSALGYTVSWGMWGACDVGAPHKRDRVFIIGYAPRFGRSELVEDKQNRLSGRSMEIRKRREATVLPYEEISPLLSLQRKIPKPSGKVVRNDNGLPEALDEIRCYGNAVVPQQAFPIFEAIANIEITNI